MGSRHDRARVRGDAEKVATHLRWPLERAQAALNYARDYREEVDAELADNDAMDFAALQRMLPQIQLFVVPNDTDNNAEDIPSGEGR